MDISKKVRIFAANFKVENMVVVKDIYGKILISIENTDTLVAADLSGKNLDFADFRGQDISEADFIGSSLKEADFSDATCICTCFDLADVSGARFTGSDLYGATFYGTTKDWISRHDTY